MTRSTLKKLEEPQMHRRRKVVGRQKRNESLAIAGRNLFDDKASDLITSHNIASVSLIRMKDGVVQRNTSNIRTALGKSQHQGTHKVDECDSNKPHEQVCLSGGDIYDDLSLLRFYQNDDLPPWGNMRRRTTGEEGPNWVIRTMIHMPKGTKVLKDLLSHKEKLEKADLKFYYSVSSVSYTTLPLLTTRHLRTKANKNVYSVDWQLRKFHYSVSSVSYTTLPLLTTRHLRTKANKNVYLVDWQLRKSVRAACSRDNCLYCVDHTANLVQEQWVDTLIHDRKWTDIEDEIDSEKESPKLELKELPDHLEYAFLQEDD
ncbi:hypothetical protein Tco_1027058 [Tanacetum coccineum]